MRLTAGGVQSRGSLYSDAEQKGETRMSSGSDEEQRPRSVGARERTEQNRTENKKKKKKKKNSKSREAAFKMLSSSIRLASQRAALDVCSGFGARCAVQPRGAKPKVILARLEVLAALFYLIFSHPSPGSSRTDLSGGWWRGNERRNHPTRFLCYILGSLFSLSFFSL